ncbi:MAG TPA: TerC/Alx family metal homeostasis membrane protein, partial [Solirubrobacteraceae bacterium]|nr:TerC/Alx family metal homeostasis membrane protein [Solirubrobacteraceae bacterium]
RRSVGMRGAVVWSVFYIGVAVLFGVAFGWIAGWDAGGQYFAGYVVEKSLSIDNLFVFVIIMSALAVPAELQRNALTIGIAFALVLRAAFILLGAALLDLFSLMLLVFGVALLFTAIQMFRHRDQDPTVDDNPLIALAKRTLPFTGDYRGSKLVTHVKGRLMLTPLLLVLVAIGSTDLLFAFDSIPAVFGVTQHAYIVLCANAFALLGLRALFFLVAGVLDRLVYLSSGLAVILAFIGAKLILHYAHTENGSVPEISTGVSLAVIAVILTVTALASVLASRRDPSLRTHAGTVSVRRQKTAEKQASGGDAARSDTSSR